MLLTYASHFLLSKNIRQGTAESPAAPHPSFTNAQISERWLAVVLIVRVIAVVAVLLLELILDHGHIHSLQIRLDSTLTLDLPGIGIDDNIRVLDLGVVQCTDRVLSQLGFLLSGDQIDSRRIVGS